VRSTVAPLAVLAAIALPPPALAFRRAEVGTPIRDRALLTVGGQRAPLLTPGQVSVFVFVHPGQEHSESALRQLAVLPRRRGRRALRRARRRHAPSAGVVGRDGRLLDLGAEP